MLLEVEMYTRLLVELVAIGIRPPDGIDLLTNVRDRATAMNAASVGLDRLVAMIRYDLALLWLSSAIGIVAAVDSFTAANGERRRLEVKLRACGFAVGSTRPSRRVVTKYSTTPRR
jgi:hypothetical protein